MFSVIRGYCVEDEELGYDHRLVPTVYNKQWKVQGQWPNILTNVEIVYPFDITLWF